MSAWCWHTSHARNVSDRAYARNCPRCRLDEAFIKANPNLPYENYKESTWDTITQASGFEKKRIHDILGFESVDIILVLITTYFLNKEGLRNADAQIYESINKLFKN